MRTCSGSGQGCYQSIKDKNFESNSQLEVPAVFGKVAVISLSKIKISKKLLIFVLKITLL